MKSYRSAFIIVLLAACALIPFMRSQQASSQAPAARSREDAYRANNLGVALLEQYKHKEGADQFRRALALDPKLVLARVNLAIALYNVPDLPGAQKEAEAAAAAAPNAPQPQ